MTKIPRPPVTEGEAAEFRDRVRAAYVGAPKHQTSPEATEQVTQAAPTIVRYEALRMPRGNIVVEQPSKRVEAQFGTFEEAAVHADQLNKWLSARPAADRRYRMFVPPPEPTEAALLAMFERSAEVEVRPLTELQVTIGGAERP